MSEKVTLSELMDIEFPLVIDLIKANNRLQAKKTEAQKTAEVLEAYRRKTGSLR